MTANDPRDERPAEPAQPQQPGLLSPECRVGYHGYQCSRNPHSMPSWPLLAVCECACHDTHDARRTGKEGSANG